MLVTLNVILGLIISYLLGSIPSAFIIGKLIKKIDIRDYGSGNVGATNVFRVLGKVPGTIVLIMDIAKGILATMFLADILGLPGVIYKVIFGLVAVSGHIWTVFLKFKGGKGVATSLGVLLGLAIKIAGLGSVLLLTLATWIVVFVISGFVSLASLLAAILAPIYMLIFNLGIEVVSLGIILCVIIVLRHLPNIKRLLAGVESRVDVLKLLRKRFL